MNDDEVLRAVEQMKPVFHGPRLEILCHEFDAVDFTSRLPGRALPETVLAYFDSGLSLPQLVDRLDDMLTDMADVLARTTSVPLEPRLSWSRRTTTELRTRKERPPVREALAAALREDNVSSLYLRFDAVDGTDRWWLLDVWAYPWPEKAPDAALTMSLTSRDLWPDEAAEVVAEEVLALFCRWLIPLRLRTAGITLDRAGPHASPWDRWYGTNDSDTAPVTTERLRGYYWANLLTAGHIHRLGGLDRLRGHAAEHGLIVEPALADTEDAVIVRAPVAITAFGDDLLAAAKHVLGPAMPHRQYVLYQGRALRIIPDPGTAFRKVPPGSPFPHLLDGRGPWADEVP